jgi:hypothetical protein
MRSSRKPMTAAADCWGGRHNARPHQYAARHAQRRSREEPAGADETRAFRAQIPTRAKLFAAYTRRTPSESLGATPRHRHPTITAAA